MKEVTEDDTPLVSCPGGAGRRWRWPGQNGAEEDDAAQPGIGACCVDIDCGMCGLSPEDGSERRRAPDHPVNAGPTTNYDRASKPPGSW